MHRLLPFALPPVPRMRMPHQQAQAARLNDLLFEVVTRVAPHVAYSFVSKSRLRFTLLPVLAVGPPQGGRRSRR